MPEYTGNINFFENFWGGMAIMNGGIIVLSWTAILVVGWSRFSAIPLIMAVIGVLVSWLDTMPWHPDKLGRTRQYTMKFFMLLFWHIQEVLPIFYSYFILMNLLKNRQKGFFGRQRFVLTFWFLAILNFAVRGSSLGVEVLCWDTPRSPAYDTYHRHLNNLYLVMFTFTAASEVLTATYLLKIFRESKRNAEMYFDGVKVGLFKRMALSTEIRLTSLAGIGITRAVCSSLRYTSDAAYGIDMVMWGFEQAYSMLLILDLLVAKIAGMCVKMNKPKRTSLWCSCKCSCGMHEMKSGNIVEILSTVELEDATTKRASTIRTLTDARISQRIDPYQHHHDSDQRRSTGSTNKTLSKINDV